MRRLVDVVLIFFSLGMWRAPQLCAQDPVLPHGPRFWLGTAVLAAAAFAADRPLRAFAAAHQSRSLDHVADDIDPLGRAKYVVPSLAAAVAVPVAFRDWPVATASLRVSAGYVAADLAGGILRVAVARHRPDSTGNPWRFRPLRPQGDWGSMPSAHVTHAFALAAGVAEETGRPWVAALSYGVASLLAAQRVYRQAHWASDVVVGAAISTAVSRRIVRLLDR